MSDQQLSRQIVEIEDTPPTSYMRPPDSERMIREIDVEVQMRDGLLLKVDVYRPDMEGRFPALFALGMHPKNIQDPEFNAGITPQPGWARMWIGHQEAGDPLFFVSRGYAHVVASPRGIGPSPGGGSREWDAYDVIEWIAQQPWCDGQVGGVGIGTFAGEQLAAAKQKPPSLKVIFPFDPTGAYVGPNGFSRDSAPGGVIHMMRYLLEHFSAVHTQRGMPGELDPETDALWQDAMANPDFKMYPPVYNVLAQKGQHMAGFFHHLLDPYDREEAWAATEERLRGIEVPTYIGSGWHAYTYKAHVQGAQHTFPHIRTPKKLLFNGPAHLERPLRALRGEMLRWYDHWLKGIDSGILDEPPVKYFVMGANRWRTAADWPPPEVKYTKLYLSSWERLTPEAPIAGAYDAVQHPDSFVQMPMSQTAKAANLRYYSDPLPDDVTIAGPIVLNLFAGIDQEDTNWIVILKDIGPDNSVRTAKEGEREIPTDLPEREVTRGWLKASMRALDPERSQPHKPWHKLTREARQPIVPGEINEYAIEILATANMFRARHRICIEITALDLPTGTAGMSNIEYIPYHICSAKTVVHHIYRDATRSSHLLLPVVDG